jgi:hypothetical protein
MVRSKKTKQQGETEKDFIESSYNGMFIDLPGSEKPAGGSHRNVNCNDYGKFTEGRAGSRLYSEATRPSGTLYGKCDHKKSGYVIKIYGSKLYICDKAMTFYEEVFLMKGVTFSGECKIFEYGEDAVIVNLTGVYLLVFSDYFKYVRKMNPNCPELSLDEKYETVDNKFGYRYSYSYLQRSGNVEGDWDRLSNARPPIFESGTIHDIDHRIKDYSTFYFKDPCGLTVTENVISTLCALYSNLNEDHKTVTDYGIYRSKNIGENSNPSGYGLGSLNNNPANLIWVKDIPIAKSIVASSFYGVATVSSGEITVDDIGCTIYWYDENGYSSYTSSTITGVNSDTEFTHDNNGIWSKTIGGIGHGRLFAGYQTGDIFYCSLGTPFVEGDEGCPIWLSNGKIIWIKDFISSSQVRVAYSQEIENCGATIRPLIEDGTLIRNFNDTVTDEILESRIECGQPIYWPRRFYTPIPNGDIGHIDFGFIFIAKRDDTIFYYTDIGAKKYALGYYRADHQKEVVDTHIKEIVTAGSTLTIIMSNKTRTASPQTASDVGNKDNAESVWKIPPSTIVDNRGVVLYGSIAYKSGNLIAITSEPALRIFNGSKWSDENYAKDQVQKYLEGIDQSKLVAAVYIPGRFGGYKVWFKRWIRI